jgi:aldehyde dehydrogenase
LTAFPARKTIRSLAETWTTASRSAKPRPPTCRWPSITGATFAGCIRAQEGTISEIDHDTVAYHFHEPLGVVGQIIPWNFPLLMATWKLAPALAAGNCVVLKPAEQTPASILVLGRTGRRPAAAGRAQHRQRLRPRGGKPLASSSRVAKIAFTGETTTGRLIMQYASQNLIPVTLELGGKSPNIFFADVCQEDDDFFDKAHRRLRHVRAEPGRGLHLPQPRADSGEHLRPLHGARAQARAAIKQANPLDPTP